MFCQAYPICLPSNVSPFSQVAKCSRTFSASPEKINVCKAMFFDLPTQRNIYDDWQTLFAFGHGLRIDLLFQEAFLLLNNGSTRRLFGLGSIQILGV